MQRFTIGAAVIGVLAATAGVRADDAKEANYYPLKKGNNWTYRIKGGDETVKVEVTSADKEGALLSTSHNDMVGFTERIQVKDDGVYRTEVNMMKPEAPIKIVKLPVKKGDSWEIDTKVGAETVKGKFAVREDEVTVPAGKYKAIVVECKDFEINGQKINLATWYADKVGIVKIVYTAAGVESALELEKFVEGK